MAAAALSVLAACGGSKANLPLEGTQWKLTEMNGEADPVFEAEEDTFNFVLDPSENKLLGRGACNYIFGYYGCEGEDELVISQLAGTKMACPDQDVETRFGEQLQEVDRFSIEGDRLTLFADGRAVLVFKGTKADLPPASDGDGEADSGE